MALKDDLDAAKAALTQVDSDSDKVSADITAVQTRITNLLSQIPDAPTLQAAADLAAQAKAEVAKLDASVAVLDAMGTTTP